MKQTTLDLNGPILSFVTNPVGVASTGVTSGTGSGIVTFTGIATATFPTQTPENPASNTGIITYRWYEVGVGALSDNEYVTGTATTSLTLSRLITPNDHNRQFYLTADYIPSAYQSSTPVTAGTARSTGNAINEPVSSGIGTVTVYPLLEIVAEPTDKQAARNGCVTFTVDAGLTDSRFGDVSYQWYVNGNAVDDGVVTETTTTSTTTVGFQSYTFTSDGNITLPSDATSVELTVAGASGGRGGNDSGGSGNAGALGRIGRHYYSSGARTLTFRIGRKGNDGTTGNQNAGGAGGASSYARGGDGGGAGPNGSSGGGGGGGGATAVYDSVKGGYTIVAAGGAGGGGGSLNASANTYIGVLGTGGGLGFGRARAAMEGGYDSPKPGTPGGTASNDGGGGGGGGAGAQPSNFSPHAEGGPAGQDNVSGGQGGAGGASGHDSRYATFYYNGYGIDGDGYVSISFNGTASVPTTTTRKTTVTGSKTPSLTLCSDTVGVQTVFVRISNPLAVNSPLDSIIVDFATLSTAIQYKVQVEAIGITNNATVSNIDLFNGEYTFSKTSQDVENPERSINYYSFYSPDKDITVEMDLYGGKGSNNGIYVGGEGGFSRIRFTMQRNVEYVISGLNDEVNAPFLYRKGQLIACVGGGGNAGSIGNGGFGGGIGISGQNGFGRGGGNGGISYASGTLPSDGVYGSLTTLESESPDTNASSPDGGRVIPCARGVYWRNEGFTACQDVGTSQFILDDGTVVANTGSVTRGFKAGYDITQTAGSAIGNGGNGGSGATGGDGGDNAGGGGGSGYTDGSVTLVNSTLGGSTGNARVIMRVVS
jgi:hypothetical protein